MVEVQSVNQPARAPRRRNRRRRAVARLNASRQTSRPFPWPKTVGGINFLKCAFAEPDFDTTGAMGVPDLYAGRSLGKLHAYNASITFPAGMDTYILQVPFPGVAYFVYTVANGLPITGQFFPIQYSDVNTMGFGTLGQTGESICSTIASSFRSVSLAQEIIPTTNEMTWTGNISTARFPLRFSSSFIQGTTTASTNPEVVGMSGLTTAITAGYSGNLYNASFERGVYCPSLNRAPTFEFHDFPVYNYTATTGVLQTDSPVNIKVPINSTTGVPYVTGIDDLDTIVTRVSIPAGPADMTAIIKTWHCVEYVPAPGSALYEFSHIAPPYDLDALLVYKQVAANLPTAVSCYENANFWQRVLGLMGRGLAAARYVPGVVGAVANGANALTRAFNALSM
jgi:hypothetical protein